MINSTCNGDCSNCPGIIGPNKHKVSEVVHNGRTLFGEEYYREIQINCPNLTGCMDCKPFKTDDDSWFCEIKGCKKIQLIAMMQREDPDLIIENSVDLQKGDQVIFIPPGNIPPQSKYWDHCQNGFVMSVNGDTVNCRFWNTTANLNNPVLSDLSYDRPVNIKYLFKQETVDQTYVNSIIEEIEN